MFCARLFICTLWSPAGKGLTSWLSFVVSSVSLSLSHWYPGSGVVLDCIDSWSLHHYLLLKRLLVLLVPFQYWHQIGQKVCSQSVLSSIYPLMDPEIIQKLFKLAWWNLICEQVAKWWFCTSSVMPSHIICGCYGNGNSQNVSIYPRWLNHYKLAWTIHSM